MEKDETHNESITDIIDSMEELLKPGSEEVIERCYQSVWHSTESRYFDNSIETLDDKTFDSKFPLVSVVILTANKMECDVLNYLAQLQSGSKLCKRSLAINIFNGRNSTSPDAYLFQMNSVYILHLHAAETGAFTPGGSADLVRFVSERKELRPNCIISFGICYGRDPKEQKIGDVIIPRKLYPWSIGQKISEERFTIKHDNFNLCLEDLFDGDDLYSVLKSFCNGEDGKKVSGDILLTALKESGERENSVRFSTNLFYGNMSTGEAVVSSSEAKIQIALANRNERELGGEMEGYGLAKECVYHAKIPCFIVKAICDWGAHKDIVRLLREKRGTCPDDLKDKLQAYAAFCAGIVLFELLNENKDYFLRLNIIKYLGKAKGNSLISKCNYCERREIVKSLGRYYDVPAREAASMLKFFNDNHVFKCSSTNGSYRIGDDFAMED